MRALVSLTENFGTNPGLDDWSWSTYTESPGLFSVYFFMKPNLSPFVINLLLIDVPNMHDAQREAYNPSSIEILMG